MIWVDGGDKGDVAQDESIPQLRARLGIPPSPPVTSTVLIQPNKTSGSDTVSSSYIRSRNTSLAEIDTKKPHILLCDSGSRTCREVAIGELAEALLSADGTAGKEKEKSKPEETSEASKEESKEISAAATAVETIRSGIEKLKSSTTS